MAHGWAGAPSTTPEVHEDRRFRAFVVVGSFYEDSTVRGTVPSSRSETP